MNHLSVTHQTILESILAGYWEWNFQEWTVYLSPRFKSTFGYKEDELDEKADTIRSLINPDDLRYFDEQVKKHIEQGGRTPFVTELRYRHKDGSTVWINCTGGVVEWDGQGNPVKLVGCHVNITHLKEAEQAMLAEKKLLEDYFDLNLDLLAIMQSNGKLVRVNEQWTQSLGYTKEELYQSRFTDFIHPQDLSKVMQFFLPDAESFHFNQAEFTVRYKGKDGIYRTIEWRLLVKQDLIYASARDITLRIEASQERDRLRRMNESIVRATTDGILMHNDKAEIVFYNHSAARMLDLLYPSPDNYATVILPELKVIHEDGTVYPYEEYPPIEVLKYGRPVFNRVMGVVKNNAPQILWLLVNSVPIKEEDADNTKVAAVITSITDISELKVKELKLQDSIQVTLSQKARLEQFAHLVSHNLRAHSGNIAALIDLIATVADEKEKQELFGYLQKASAQLTQTIADLNQIVDAKREEEVKPLNLRMQIANVINALAADIREKAVEVCVDVPENLQIVYKPAYLESILLNLMTNAIKYRHPERVPHICIRSYCKQGYVWLEVADNGIGIDLQKHGKKLFGMYKTFHGNKDAKGIGLYITKNQIEEMGGTIAVESTLGEGTKFIIRLAPASV